jgi:hypothetical protein
MKNIFFILLILSANFIYSAETTIDVKKQEKLQTSHKSTIYSSYLEEEDDDEDENVFLNDEIANERYSFNGWKIVKGLAGLWIGKEFFFCGSKGVLFLILCPDHILSDIVSQSFTPVSPVEKFLTNRFLWLSLSSTLTVFSLWVLKKSAINLYKGLHAAEDTMEYFD